MNLTTEVQILNEVLYISHSANTLGKDTNPTIFTPTMNKIIGQTGLFNFGLTTGLGEGKLWIQTSWISGEG